MRWLAFECEISVLTCAVQTRGSLGLRAKVAVNCAKQKQQDLCGPKNSILSPCDKGQAP